MSIALSRRRATRLFPLVVPLLLAACGSVPPRPAAEQGEAATPAPATTRKAPPKAAAYVLKKGGGFYKDDGPGDNPPEDMEAIPDAVPQWEPLHRFANNPYSVLGKDYVPMKDAASYKVRGIASWYGRKFHGQKTSSGEPYDMYGMTAAHTTLPIPSYVRVSNPANGRVVVLRVNDRGPFHGDRIIDLSYTAAWKLGLTGNGSGLVEVESLRPGEAPGPLPPLAARNPPPPEDDPIARLASEPAPAAPAVAEARGTFIQLGAFGNPDNADSFRTHMTRELDWLSDRFRTEVAGKLHRVQIGPFASRAEAEAAVSRIANALGVRPTIIVR